MDALLDCVLSETRPESEPATQLLAQVCADVPAIRRGVAGARLTVVDLLGFESAVLREGDAAAEGPADARAYAAAWFAIAVLQNHRGNREDLTLALGRALAALSETWPASRSAVLQTMRAKLGG